MSASSAEAERSRCIPSAVPRPAGIHRGELLRAGAGIIPRFLGALVAKDKADIALIACDRGDTGVDIHIIVLGNIVRAFRRDGHALLPEDGVDEAAGIHTAVIVLLDDKLGGVELVDPFWHSSLVGATHSHCVPRQRR